MPCTVPSHSGRELTLRGPKFYFEGGTRSFLELPVGPKAPNFAGSLVGGPLSPGRNLGRIPHHLGSQTASSFCLHLEIRARVTMLRAARIAPPHVTPVFVPHGC